MQFNPSTDTLLTPTSVQFVINERDIIVVKISRMREQCILGLHFPPPQNTKAWGRGYNQWCERAQHTIDTDRWREQPQHTIDTNQWCKRPQHTIDVNQWCEWPQTHYWHRSVVAAATNTLLTPTSLHKLGEAVPPLPDPTRSSTHPSLKKPKS